MLELNNFGKKEKLKLIARYRLIDIESFSAVEV